MKLFNKNKAVSETQTTSKVTLKNSWKSNRKLRLGASATVFTVVVVAAILLLNVIFNILSDRFPWSLDLTPDKTFSLSEDSLEVAEKIPDAVTITAFSQESVFSSPNTGSEEYDTILRQFYHFTKEYDAVTNGKVKTEYVDLEANPALAKTYEKYGVSTGDILFRRGTKHRVINLNDLVFEEFNAYGDPNVQSLVEQKLATNINAICGEKSITLSFLTGHGEDEQTIEALKKMYEMNGYFTETVNFASAQKIADNAGALVITAPTKDYTQDEITRLRTWLNNNGKMDRHLFVFCNYAGTCPNLYEFLSVDYGITVTDKIIMETDSNKYPMDMYGSYPYFPITTVEKTDLTLETIDKSVLMPFTLQLKTALTDDDEKELVTNHKLVTFPESSRLVSLANLAEAESEEDIVKEKAQEYPIVGMAYAREIKTVDNVTTNTYVVVSGSYQYALQAAAAQYENYENEGLVIEPIRNVCSLGDTVMISGKNLVSKTVTFSSLTAVTLGLGVFTVGIPLVLIVACLVTFFKRRHL
ncbi:MAG: GldG family protein [Clostridia bacterium]|nr:GldG family protein [Clostridia bacterium]